MFLQPLLERDSADDGCDQVVGAGDGRDRQRDALRRVRHVGQELAYPDRTGGSTNRGLSPIRGGSDFLAQRHVIPMLAVASTCYKVC